MRSIQVKAGSKSAKTRQRRNILRSIRLCEAMAYACTPSDAHYQPFHLIAIGSCDVLLIYVCLDESEPDEQQIAKLAALRVPAFAKRIIHRWPEGAWAPTSQEL